MKTILIDTENISKKEEYEHISELKNVSLYSLKQKILKIIKYLYLLQ
jgi:hypothetical protein